MINETSNSDSNKKIVSPEQTQYKTIQEKTIAGEKVFTIIDVDPDDDKDISPIQSIKTRGALAPIFYMADGVTPVNGRHRLSALPNYPFKKVIIEDCKTEDQAIIDGLILNCCQRPIYPEEKRRNIEILARKYGYTVKEISDETGLGHTCVNKYYPQELKGGHVLSGEASAKARALKAAQQETPAIAELPSPSTWAADVEPASSVADADEGAAVVREQESDLLDAEFIPLAEQNQSQEPSSEEKTDALTAEFDRKQQQLEKLICDATANLPDVFKRAVYDLAFNPAKELTQKRLNDCLTTTIEVLLDFIEQEGTLQELLKTASERW